MKKILPGIALIICCLAGHGNLYDKFLIPRFVLASLSLLILFLFSVPSRKTFRVSNSNVFLIYSFFILLSGVSVIGSINLGEAVFQACQYLMGFMICIVFFDFLTVDYQGTKKVLWISAAIILTIYLIFAVIQLLELPETNFMQLYAVSGINGHKNLLSIMLFMLSAFLLTALSEIKSKLLKAIVLFLFGISISIVVFLKSRAVILSLIISVVFFLVVCFLRKRNLVRSKKLKTIVAIVGIILSFLFLTVFLRHIVSSQVPSTYEKNEAQHSITSTSSLVERFTLWNKTYHVVDKYPCWGCGVGNWQICFPDAGLEGLNRADYWNVDFTKPHNEYLGILAENGHVGLFLFLVFFCSLIVFSGYAINKITDKKEFFFGAITLSIVCGCCVNAFFDFPNSRVEHLIWISILYSILFHFISNTQKTAKPQSISGIWNFVFLIFAILMVIVGIIRFKGECESVKMQQALQLQDWEKAERHSNQAVSAFYTVDPVGMPLYWYHGQSLKAISNPQSINSFRQAYRDVPFCKENLNDLGVDEYYIAGNREQAKFLLQEAIRISPHYIYPFFNLACIYLGENELRKAKEVIDMIDFDEQRRDFLKKEARFFEPFNIEEEKQRIDADYETIVTLRHVIDSINAVF